MALDLTDFQIEIVEENIVDGILAFFVENFPGVIDEINDVKADTNRMDQISEFYDDYVDPQQSEYFPYASIFVDESEDQVKNRAMDINRTTVRILIADAGEGSLKRMYRYHAGILWMVQHDRTFGGTIGRVRVMKRVYYTPMSMGDDEIRVSETFLEVFEEVERR